MPTEYEIFLSHNNANIPYERTCPNLLPGEGTPQDACTDTLDLLQNKVFDKFHGYHAPQWGQIWRKIGQAHSK